MPNGAGNTYSNLYKHQYNIIDNKVVEIKTVVVHKFLVQHSDDPIIDAAEPLLEWQNSEQGQWVMAHAVEVPEWRRFTEPATYNEQFVIVARLKAIDYTFWQLKWAQAID